VDVGTACLFAVALFTESLEARQQQPAHGLIPSGGSVGAPSARGEPFDSPLMVSLSNHERLAQDVLVEPRAVGSSFRLR